MFLLTQCGMGTETWRQEFPARKTPGVKAFPNLGHPWPLGLFHWGLEQSTPTPLSIGRPVGGNTEYRHGAVPWTGRRREARGTCGNSAGQSLQGPCATLEWLAVLPHLNGGGRLSPTCHGQMGFMSSPGLRLSRLPAAPSSLEPTAGLAACAEWQPLSCLKPSSSQRRHSLGRS